MAHFHQHHEGHGSSGGMPSKIQYILYLEGLKMLQHLLMFFNISSKFFKSQIPGSYTENLNPEMESESQRERSHIFKPTRGAPVAR